MAYALPASLWLGIIVAMTDSALDRPVAVFDAGIGSYAIVDLIHRRLPRQDIVYLADRASFPYGGKDGTALLATMQRTIAFLDGYAPSAIVIASNAPSIMVLDALEGSTSVPLLGVRPPLAEALATSHTGSVGIMGVRSLVASGLLDRFIRGIARDPSRVAAIDASDMVDLVETGRFLFAPDETQQAVDAFAAKLMTTHPAIDVLTLSSTHLPWLRAFFERALPAVTFLDPAEQVVESIGAGTAGSGRILGLVTETPAFPVAVFRQMLAAIGADIPLERVTIEDAYAAAGHPAAIP